MPDRTDAQARLAERIGAVRARFLAGVDDRVSELVALAEAASAASGAEAETVRQALGRGLHTIAGSAPTIGLQVLGDRARALEAELARADQDGTPLSRTFIDAVTDLRDIARQGAQ